MKLMIEKWRKFTERLNGPERSKPEKHTSIYQPLTQVEFAETLNKRGADGSWPSSIAKEERMQVGVLLGLFNSLKGAPDSDPEWYGSRMPDVDKGEGFSVSTILNSIYKVGGETEDFLFANKQAALDFFRFVQGATTNQPDSFKKNADADTAAPTIKAT